MFHTADLLLIDVDQSFIMFCVPRTKLVSVQLDLFRAPNYDCIAILDSLTISNYRN